ncbi:MAG TPA: YceI family protein [Mycobacterium sp.]|nr:YceI family protein [Mycobacterium sp.]
MSTIEELLSSPQAVGEWALVAEKSSFQFSNTTFWGAMTVKGRFTDFSGEGRIGPDGKVSGQIVIKAASLRTGIGLRDNHLRSADFFDVEHYPDIVVRVVGAQPAKSDRMEVDAQLSIRGNTAALPLEVRVSRLDDGAVRLTGTTTVDRERFAVSGNMVGMVGKTTTVSADAVFRRSGD